MRYKPHLTILCLMVSVLSMQGKEDIYRPIDPGEHLLEVGKQICFIDKELIVGSCWDFVNAVYLRAGYVPAKRDFIFKSGKAGPYADLDMIKAGDWLYFLNQEYGGIEHSAIFVSWINREKKIAKTLDYVGGKRNRVGKYTSHLMTHVYNVVRPKVVQSIGVK